MMSAPLRDRIRYSFDNFMARGTIALIGGLALISLAIVIVSAAIIAIIGISSADGSRFDFIEAAWMSLMRTLDAGTMGGDTGWSFRFVMLGVTLGGIFVISTLIGVLSTGIEARLEELRKGRSHVIEHNHTIILGWSEQIYSIITELITANANRRHPCIVILGNKDKVEMEDAIRERIGATGNTRVICRTGEPTEPSDLAIVSLQTARSIIVLTSEENDPDSHVIKTLLAITRAPNRRSQPYHIVAEIRDPQNMEVGRMVGQNEVELVLVGELIARIIAQTCRQSGLSVVYTELLDFGGDEIYFHAEPSLVGHTFGDALLSYEDSTVIGLHPRGGSPRLNPPMDTPLKEGDQLIVISEDDDTIRLSKQAAPPIDPSAIADSQAIEQTPEHTLILGWNWRAPRIIKELDQYVAPGSTLIVVADMEEAEQVIAEQCSQLTNTTLTFRLGNTTERRLLDELMAKTYHHIILLCYETLEPQAADSRTLITLLHLRDIAERTGQKFSIVSEMLDVRNRNLAEVTKADDFIVSDRLVSLILSQVSENKALNAVFTDIFDPEGSEIYLKPAAQYVKLNVAINFYTVVEAARRRGEVAIGYRLQAHANDATKSYGVVVNPDKSNPITFGPNDRIVVIAEG